MKNNVILITGLITLVASLFFWLKSEPDNAQTADGKPSLPPTAIMVSPVGNQDVAVTLKLNGILTTIQSVDIRPQVSAIIREIHIREGQSVQQGQLLFTLDMRTEEANLNKARAQAEKTRTDLRNAERHFQRQSQLFSQNFIARSLLDEAENQVNLLKNQLKLDLAAVEADRVTRSHGKIHSPISGRTGAIPFHIGTLVGPDTGSLVNVTRIDPIHVSFELPEQALPNLQIALARSEVVINVHSPQPESFSRQGKIIFIDNKVNAASGTILVKAEIPNADNYLWPGRHVEVTLAPQVLQNAATVPTTALMVGPRGQFVYVLAEDDSVRPQPVKSLQVQDGLAAIEGIATGICVVVEGMQQVFPGSKVKIADPAENRQTCTRVAAPEKPVQRSDGKRPPYAMEQTS